MTTILPNMEPFGKAYLHLQTAPIYKWCGLSTYCWLRSLTSLTWSGGTQAFTTTWPKKLLLPAVYDSQFCALPFKIIINSLDFTIVLNMRDLLLGSRFVNDISRIWVYHLQRWVEWWSQKDMHVTFTSKWYLQNECTTPVLLCSSNAKRCKNYHGDNVNKQSDIIALFHPFQQHMCCC